MMLSGKGLQVRANTWYENMYGSVSKNSKAVLTVWEWSILWWQNEDKASFNCIVKDKHKFQILLSYLERGNTVDLIHTDFWMTIYKIQEILLLTEEEW